MTALKGKPLKDRLDLILDQVEAKKIELRLDTPDGSRFTPDQVRRVEGRAKARGFSALFDGRGFLIRDLRPSRED